MNNYIAIVEIVVPDEDAKSEIRTELLHIKFKPNRYLETNERGATKDDDYEWLAMIDLLIDNGYAYELDWKERVDSAEEQTEKLLSKNNYGYTFDNEISADLDAEEFFPLLNQEVMDKTPYSLCNFYIDSDSYISVLCAQDQIEGLKELDSRIKPY